MNRSYTQEEVQQILNLAIARQAHAGEFTRIQLLEIAADLEISPASLQAAEAEWQQQRSIVQQRGAFDAYRRAKLKRKAGRYLIVNAFLVALNLLASPGFLWSLFILLIWGLDLSLEIWNFSQMQGEEYERAFESWYRKHQIRRTLNSWLGKLFKA